MRLFVIVKDKTFNISVESNWSIRQLKSMIESDNHQIKFDVPIFSEHHGTHYYKLRHTNISELVDTWSLKDANINDGDDITVFKRVMFPFYYEQGDDYNYDMIEINLYWTIFQFKKHLQMITGEPSFTLNLNESDEEYLDDILHKYDCLIFKRISPKKRRNSF